MTNIITNMIENTSTQAKGFLIAAIGVTLISLDFIFIRFSGVTGFNTAFLFGLFSCISMLSYIKFVSRKSIIKVVKTSGWALFFSGALMLMSVSSLIFATKTTEIANIAVIFSAAPALSALFSWLFLREKTKASTWIAIVIVMAGIVIVVSGSLHVGHLFGNVLAVVGASGMALNYTLTRKYKHISRIGAIGMGGFLIAVVYVFLANPSTYSLHTWIIMAVMGLFSAPFGRAWNLTATRYITASEVGLIVTLSTVLGPIWGYLFFREVPSVYTVIGGIIIVVTLILYSLSGMKRNKL